ncbi:MAG: NAD+ kinase [Marinoscillum sp.]
MRKIAIHGRRIAEDSVSHVEQIFSFLKSKDCQVYISPQFSELLISRSITSNYPIYDTFYGLEGFELILSLGGDGTLLDTLTHVGSSQLPILGINLGRLGFLAVISKENIDDALESYFQGNFTYDDRSLISLESSSDLFNGHGYALNEFAILRKDTSSMIVVKCCLDGEYLNTYWADGLIVATPTGSTGYSLSCGGPVIIPNTRNFIITPISPHNLNVRPLIVSEDSELTIKIESRNPSYQVSLDSRSESIEQIMEFKVKKAPFCSRLVKIDGTSFLDTLRNKLTWGLDKRN